jgi:hypothetical protein
MGRRLDLQSRLESILGTPNVYFQPPTNVQIMYPCIIYKRDYADTKYADDSLYHHTQRYQVTVIDRDPDSEIPSQIAGLPLCQYDRFYTADNLNHDVYTLFF